MATALHFFPYYFVHGKSMIYLGLACAINVFAGYIFTSIPLEVIACIDAAIKLLLRNLSAIPFKAVKTKVRQIFGTAKQGGPGRIHASGAAPISESYFLAPNARVHAQRVSTAVPTATAIGSHALAP